MKSYVMNTIKGGVFFMLPLVLVIMIAGKAVTIIRPVAHFLANQVSPDTVLGEQVIKLIAIILLLIICFVFGLVAASGAGKSIVAWIEENVLMVFPGYQYMKSSMQAAAGVEDGENLEVVLVPIDGWMIGFVMEPLPNDELVIFIPGSPNTREGSVVIIPRKDTRPSNLTQKQALQILKQAGIGMQQKQSTGA